MDTDTKKNKGSFPVFISCVTRAQVNTEQGNKAQGHGLIVMGTFTKQIKGSFSVWRVNVFWYCGFVMFSVGQCILVLRVRDVFCLSVYSGIASL